MRDLSNFHLKIGALELHGIWAMIVGVILAIPLVALGLFLLQILLTLGLFVAGVALVVGAIWWLYLKFWPRKTAQSETERPHTTEDGNPIIDVDYKDAP